MTEPTVIPEDAKAAPISVQIDSDGDIVIIQPAGARGWPDLVLFTPKQAAELRTWLNQNLPEAA